MPSAGAIPIRDRRPGRVGRISAARIVRHLGANPQYLFRPRTLLRRVTGCPRLRAVEPGFLQEMLPWGLAIRFREGDLIGREIARIGLYDLTVCEVLWRLLDQGDTAVDAGANIGVMTSLMAVRAGPAGCVHTFEPHPEIFAELTANQARWCRPGLSPIHLREAALSSRRGDGILCDRAEHFKTNRMVAQVREDPRTATSGETLHAIRLETLNDVFPDTQSVHLLKLDVEGHELEVLRGGERMLRERRIRDIVFEDWEGADSRVCQVLRRAGYVLFALEQGLVRPRVRDPHRRRPPSGGAPNFLATLDDRRARARLRRIGWGALGVGPFGL